MRLEGSVLCLVGENTIKDCTLVGDISRDLKVICTVRERKRESGVSTDTK